MKIAICLLGTMTVHNRNWYRTKDGILEKLINCWGNDNYVSVYLCSDNIPKDILEFYKVKNYIDSGSNIKERYMLLLPKLFDEDVDFIICTRPDIVFFNQVSTFNLMFDKFNFLFREVNHWGDVETSNGYGKWTCDNFYAFSKKYLLDFYNVVVNCPKARTFTGELHSQIYPCLVDNIGKKNIHFIQREPGFSGNGLNKFYLLDRYYTNPGDLGPTNIKDYEKWAIENVNKLKFHHDMINNDTKYLEDDHEHA